MIIAVDGASGTGKSTICKLLASELGLSYIDTGAIYRCVALLVKRKNIKMDDSKLLTEICKNIKLTFNFVNGINRITLHDEDVTELIRTPEISMLASHVSAVKEVRDNLLEMQKKIATLSSKGAIVDGRDIGTVVFPNAEVKIFLTASNEVRAKRRYEELVSKGMDVQYEQILKETIQRDKQDSERTLAPLKKADDAIHIDTDKLSIYEVKNQILLIIKNLVLVD